MMNIIIVEGKNDSIFFEALIRHMNLTGVFVDVPVFIDEESFEILGGSDPNPEKPTALITKLKEIKTEILKKDIRKIGVVLDLDHQSEEEKLYMVNNAIKLAFPESLSINPIKSVASSGKVTTKELEIKISCYFTNLGGRGELETLLKYIASQPSEYADCLESWRECLKRRGKNITDKAYDKFWISNYIRFDTCTEMEMRRATNYCSMTKFDYVMQKGIFNLNAPELDGIRAFFELFRD